MQKVFHVCLLCSLLAVPILGAPKAHAALIVNVETSRCLDVKFANTANGTPIRSVPCSADFSQQFKWESLAIKGIGTTSPGSGFLDPNGKCIDVVGGGIADGTLVQLFQCNRTGAQQWTFSKGQIVNVRSGKCLDIGDGNNATQARIRSCNPGVASQRFALRSVQLVNLRGGIDGRKCLSVLGGFTNNGTPLQGAPCEAAFAQAWNWEFFGIQGIGTNSQGSRCVDVSGGTADFSIIQLFGCNGTGAQQWQLAGPAIINTPSGKCLDVFDDNGITQAKLRTCNGTVGQRWVIR